MASTSDIPPPSYPSEAVPAYTPPSSSTLPSSSGPPAAGDSKHPKFYLQREEIYPYRHGLILSYHSSDPAQCRAQYAYRHQRPSTVSLPGSSSPPDVTLYRGGDTNGQVLGTGTLKSLILGKALAEVRMFAGSGAGAAVAVQKIVVAKHKDKAVFELCGRRLAWQVSVSQRPPANAEEHTAKNTVVPGSVEDEARKAGLSAMGRFKAAMTEKPSLLFNSYRAVLVEAEQPGTELAVYDDIVPTNPPFTRELRWKDGHAGTLEFLDPAAALDAAWRDTALLVLLLMKERAKRGLSAGKEGAGWGFTPFGSGLSGGGCGGGGGGGT
ncbi:hypothetical protein BZA05DRAFT_442472 [Tricharina praecox]|uniref:uncharacterized protein n=1 Tax=Tricharina praecox TaxID=43433 RepID=UPI0022209D8E|nr:uncharacterized protein BZA05DRAFT_442472 [Tricharina praecox]KAI5855782.1 hypothetical protein BZA05DRAFT_442472 [Tricharina praecox]